MLTCVVKFVDPGLHRCDITLGLDLSLVLAMSGHGGYCLLSCLLDGLDACLLP